jgi:tRNA threonylcarbamoyladenosine biosynthesis protein TsaB
MKLLALECATERCSTALWINGELFEMHQDGGQQRNSETLLPMVTTLMKQADLRLQDLDVIAFGSGPGAFTGLRVACGVAQGLAFGAGLPVIAIGTMEIMAEGMRMHLGSQLEPMHCLAVLDARMGEVYFAELIEEGADWRVLDGPELGRPEIVLADQSAQTLYGVGNGFQLYPDLLVQRLGSGLHWVQACLQVPDAIPLARLAADRFQRLGGVAPEQAQPLYVRDKVALTSAERQRA